MKRSGFDDVTFNTPQMSIVERTWLSLAIASLRSVSNNRDEMFQAPNAIDSDGTLDRKVGRLMPNLIAFAQRLVVERILGGGISVRRSAQCSSLSRELSSAHAFSQLNIQ